MPETQKTQGCPSLAGIRSALTSGQVAAHCQVSVETVANWIRRGRLRAYRTPGRHRRIRIDDFSEFLEANDMPPLSRGRDRAGRRQLLVVDDDPAVVRLVREVLGAGDEYEIACAADGFEAGIQIGRLCPDLVVLDLMMPHLDGFAVCRRLKEAPETSHVAVLVLSGHGQGGNAERARACGADDYMGKPFSAPELQRRVRALLEQDDGPRETVMSHPGSSRDREVEAIPRSAYLR